MPLAKAISFLARLIAVVLCVAPAARALALDVSSQGGAVEGGRVLHVTSLSDSGPGSLRWALLSPGPRVIVFDVAGYVDLKSDLAIEAGRVTIAGQTAPAGGVVIRGGGVKIRASDVVLEHVAIYPGAASDPKIAENRDGVTIYGSQRRSDFVRNVVLRNISVGWGVDENVSVQGLVDGVRIERSLIAEALWRGGHPKGIHSMNLLLGDGVRTVLLLGNVMVAGNQRNPRLTRGNIVAMLNNYIYGFGRVSTHLDSSRDVLATGEIDIVGNVYRASADSKCRQPVAQIQSDYFSGTPQPKVFLDDNIEIGRPCMILDRAAWPFAAYLERRMINRVPSWPLLAAREVVPEILDKAGARPGRRNPIDRRIVHAVRDGSSRMVDNEGAVGGWPDMPEARREAAPPVKSPQAMTAADVRSLRTWLCEQAKAVSNSGICA